MAHALCGMPIFDAETKQRFPGASGTMTALVLKVRDHRLTDAATSASGAPPAPH